MGEGEGNCLELFLEELSGLGEASRGAPVGGSVSSRKFDHPCRHIDRAGNDVLKLEGLDMITEEGGCGGEDRADSLEWFDWVGGL
eukprot:1326628-Amorphochlora_amoeboformis.AAC.1